MPDLQQNGPNDFLRETIKVKPVNKRKLLRRTILTIAMAIIFGLVACVTFLTLGPVISSVLNPEEPVQKVVFPEDLEEMSPEDMLAEKVAEETPQPSIPPAITPGSEMPPVQSGMSEEMEAELNEQIAEVLNSTSLDMDSYKELYSALSQYVQQLNKSMVVVTAVTYNRDWFNDVQESRNQCSGVIISENGQELLILADYDCIRGAEQLILTFYDGSTANATLKQKDSSINLAVLAVDLESLSETMRGEELPIAELGTSNSKNMMGTPVVALGSPMGISGSVGYGIITSNGTVLSTTDRNYKLFLTDINGSRRACGIIFNLQYQVIGIITQHTVSDMDEMLTMCGVTELKKMVEKMSNGSAVAYMGIRGMDVTSEINKELGVPVGAYVTELEFDSPAMRAGIQPGDVIVGMNDKIITTFSNYSNALMQMEPGQTVDVKILRMAQNEYREVHFNVVLDEVKK